MNVCIMQCVSFKIIGLFVLFFCERRQDKTDVVVIVNKENWLVRHND